MIPLQDVVPSGQRPFVTLGLIGLVLLLVVLRLLVGEGTAASPWSAAVPADMVSLAAALLFLWIFGDNVEARLGHSRFAVTCVLWGVLATAAMDLARPAVPPGIGLAGIVCGVIGAYLAVMPASKVLTLIPAPPFLVEVPAAAIIVFWWVLQFVVLVAVPASLDGRDIDARPMWALAMAFLTGLTVGRVWASKSRW